MISSSIVVRENFSHSTSESANLTLGYLSDRAIIVLGASQTRASEREKESGGKGNFCSLQDGQKNGARE